MKKWFRLVFFFISFCGFAFNSSSAADTAAATGKWTLHDFNFAISFTFYCWCDVRSVFDVLSCTYMRMCISTRKWTIATIENYYTFMLIHGWNSKFYQQNVSNIYNRKKIGTFSTIHLMVYLWSLLVFLSLAFCFSIFFPFSFASFVW